jgi:origin recognition complex subunit 4
MREIAYQLGQQTGTSFLASPDDVPEGMDDEGANDDESNPFLDKPTTSTSISGPSLPPSSHLPALISILPTLPRSTVVILDGFDLFSLHPRQSLLYCLLDTAQSCRASAGSKGLAVIGITSRIDTINLLEKRVKSRFSGRILRTAPPRKLEDWVKLAKATLTSDITDIHEDKDHNEEWRLIWDMAMDRFFSDKAVSNTLNETFSITRDVRMLSRMLVS